MKLETQLTDGLMKVAFHGALTFSDNGQFRKLLDEVSASGATRCVFDFSGLQAIDSSGLGMIMIAITTAQKKGWTLCVSNAVGPVAELLRLSRLDALLKAA